jgi:hypothetical protein
MKKLTANPITAWSYSRLSVFRACRLQFRFQFIDKLPQPPAPAMERGNELHKALQQYIEKKTKKLPEVIADTVGPELTEKYLELRNSKTVACELELAVDKDWKRVEWYDKACRFRVKLDVVETLGDSVYVADHKSGKIRADQHAEQLETYAAIVPTFWDDAREIIAQMLYVDQGKASSPAVFTRAAALKLRKKWDRLAAPIFKERIFKASPGDACRYCAYSKRRGGPCVQG